MVALLQITDGESIVDLINETHGIHLFEWRPRVAEFDPVYQQSPLSDGRHVVTAKLPNVDETFEYKANAADQDALIRQLQDLRRLLLKSLDYWSTRQQGEPVYLAARATCETNIRYAIIHFWRTPEDDNPYRVPFLRASGDSVAMDDLTLFVERGQWLANPPGSSECVTLFTTQSWDYGTNFVQEAATPPNDMVTSFMRHAGSGALYAGSNESRIMKSTDGGDTWANNLTASPVPSNVFCMLTLANNNILAGGDGTALGVRALIRSTNDGGAWTDVSQADMNQIWAMAQVASTGTIIAVGDSGFSDQSIWRSTNNGGSFSLVLEAAVNGGQFYEVIVVDSTHILAFASNNVVYRSTNDGAAWSPYSRLPMGIGSAAFKGIRLSDGTILIIGLSGGGLWRSTDSGLNWELVYPGSILDNNSYMWSIAEAGSGTLFALRGRIPERLMKSVDGGLTWTRLFQVSSENITGSLAPSGLYWISSLSRLLVGGILSSGNGVIYRSSASVSTTLGRTATCADEVFVANRNGTPNITHIFRDDGGVFTSIFPASLPVALLPAIPALDDAIYFISASFGGLGGASSYRTMSGLIFDIATPMSGPITLLWEFWNGAVWIDLRVQDETNGFRFTGVNGVYWFPLTTMAVTTVNGVTGLAIRARVDEIGAGTVTVATQANRDIYAVNNAGVKISSAIEGDLPALARIRVHNRSDNGDRSTTTRNLYANRVVVGLRSSDVDTPFSPYINIAHANQNLPGINVTLGTNTTFVDDIISQFGTKARYNPTGVESMATRATISFDAGVSRYYYGKFHAYLRVYRDAGVSSDFAVRLQIVSGSGGITHTTESRQVQSTVAFEVLDFGKAQLPVSGAMQPDELGDVTQIMIQVSTASATPNLDMFDLILMPTNEWAGDFVDRANETDSDLGRSTGQDRFLDIDSLTNFHRAIRAMIKHYRSVDGKHVVSNWQPNANGPAILQANVSYQTLWFLTMEAVTTGANPVWLSGPEVVNSVQVFCNPRYLSMRGDR